MDIEEQLHQQGLAITAHDTVLFYTNHYRKHFNTENWSLGPALAVSGTKYLGSKKVAAFGVETRSAGVAGKSNKEVHQICGEMGFTHYENLINLHKLVCEKKFQFIGLPLNIIGGTASPVREIAVLYR